ncbi:hypothetical protein PR202_gb15644 [Eleusine coracana subsp. coracana]|uniref:Magnesium transporter n=1 Tax=Eleusine coracana subsp. coracana TaxID=191504 RepID=A0AAV5EYW3_ELECO|nr:hypothetical protein PR202_gb15644 [Eleusine coracana subsp. coracana]
MASSSAATTTAQRRRHASWASSSSWGATTAAAAGEWGAVSRSGTWRVEEVGRHELTRRTGLPARDLRALDPALASSSYPYPSGTVTARDRAVVVNVDRVRAIVTAHEVLVPGPRDPAVAPLAQELRARLTPAPQVSCCLFLFFFSTTASLQFLVDRPVCSRKFDDLWKEDGGRALGSDKALPFEFRALEVCLDFACKSLEHETSTLEKEAYPALDQLSSNVSTLNLERLRQTKSRLVATTGRVQKVRDELEHLLDDDKDMAAMHLTEKLVYQAADRSSRYHNKSQRPIKFYKESDDDEVKQADGSSEGGNGSETSVGFAPRIDDLEILLEAYFVQIDGTLNKLSTYVDDTEDYINIMLDDKQNQLLQMGIALSTGTLVVSCAITAAGVLGMNIRIPLYDDATTAVFWQATGGIVGAGAAIYLLVLLCFRRSGILQ